MTQGQTSCNPCTDTFLGSAAFSEPETRNIRSMLDTLRIDCFADVHSFSELVLYPWGHPPTQTVDPGSRFMLFEALQHRSLPILLADEQFARQVAELLQRADRAIADGDGLLDFNLVEQAAVLLAQLAGRAGDPELTAAAAAATRVLLAAAGQPASSMIEQLMARGPRLDSDGG